MKILFQILLYLIQANKFNSSEINLVDRNNSQKKFRYNKSNKMKFIENIIIIKLRN